MNKKYIINIFKDVLRGKYSSYAYFDELFLDLFETGFEEGFNKYHVTLFESRVKLRSETFIDQLLFFTKFHESDKSLDKDRLMAMRNTYLERYHTLGFMCGKFFNMFVKYPEEVSRAISDSATKNYFHTILVQIRSFVGKDNMKLIIKEIGSSLCLSTDEMSTVKTLEFMDSYV